MSHLIFYKLKNYVNCQLNHKRKFSEDQVDILINKALTLMSDFEYFGFRGEIVDDARIAKAILIINKLYNNWNFS